MKSMQRFQYNEVLLAIHKGFYFFAIYIYIQIEWRLEFGIEDILL